VYNPQEHPANKNLALNARMGSGFSTFSKSKLRKKFAKDDALTTQGSTEDNY
jgi:hypothetical protein